MATRDNYTFVNQESIPSSLRSRIGPFFRSWDNAKSDDGHHYLSLYAPSGTLKFGQSVTGRDAIRDFRSAMVDPVKGPVVDLQHTLDRFFVLAGGEGKDGEEVLVNGTIWYRLKNGRKVDCDFSSWIVLKQNPDQGGELQAEFYEVYLDAHELMTAIGELSQE